MKGTMRGLRMTAAVSLVPQTAVAPAHADVVTDWNGIADATSVFAGGPPFRARITAMVQVAVHDALNSIERRFEPYTAIPAASGGASPGAAVAAASYQVLLATVPSQAGPLGIVYANRIAGLPACPAAHPSCIADGIAAGEAAASAILALRVNDGSATPHLPYALPPGPGVYQPTPPAFVAPQFAGWALVAPFVLNSGSQFRADPSEIFDLLGEAAGRTQLVRRGRRRHVHGLVDLLHELVEAQRAVVERARQAESELDERLLPGLVPLIHPVDLRDGHV